MYNTKKMIIYIAELLAGSVLFYMSRAGILDDPFWGGVGGALACVGLVRTLMCIRYNRDADYREKVDINAADERNRFLRYRAWAWTGYSAVMIAAIVEIAAVILKKELVMSFCALTVCTILVLYWVFYMILSRRY